MENSSYEAIFMGVYITIFLVAVSLTIYLFSNINIYADLAYEFSRVSTDASIIEDLPTNKNKLISGKDVVSYYYNYIQKDMYGSNKKRSNFVINISPNENGSSILRADQYTYDKLTSVIRPEDKYILTYDKVEKGQAYINIRKATIIEVNEKI